MSDTGGVRIIVLLVVAALVAPATAEASDGPVLQSVGHVNRHPKAAWTLPPNVEASSVEVARKPTTASNGSFFQENVVASDILDESDTRWLYERQIRPGKYYVHVRGFDASCDTDPEAECRSVWSNILPLTIPEPTPRYEARVRSVYPGAIRQPGSSELLTYPGDRLILSFRNARGLDELRKTYTVCYRGVGRAFCRKRSLLGRDTDSWSLRVLGPWVPCRRPFLIRFWWSVDGRIVARRSARIYECS